MNHLRGVVRRRRRGRQEGGGRGHHGGGQDLFQRPEEAQGKLICSDELQILPKHIYLFTDGLEEQQITQVEMELTKEDHLLQRLPKEMCNVCFRLRCSTLNSSCGISRENVNNSHGKLVPAAIACLAFCFPTVSFCLTEWCCWLLQSLCSLFCLIEWCCWLLQSLCSFGSLFCGCCRRT